MPNNIIRKNINFLKYSLIMKKKFFLGFIPARKGSQGIKNKNLILLKKKTC